MAGKDDLANAVLGGASDYLTEIGTIFIKLYRAPNEEERVIVLLLLTGQRTNFSTNAVLEIRIRNWSSIFLKMGYFTAAAVPLKMYRRFVDKIDFGRPNAEISHKNGQWPTLALLTYLNIVVGDYIFIV